jgi:hypothetical protein
MKLLIIILSLFTAGAIHADAVQNKTDEPLQIHLLVDISGSMKKTDPENLRAKAINMFVYLVKHKAQMQIQLFAADILSLMDLSPVDEHYQEQFVQKRGQITANGALTDIDLAVTKANTGWGKGERVIILLTDGAVDLGAEQITLDSRNKLSSSTIAALQKEKVKVFTVGFSAAADKQLLELIAVKTNGLSNIVQSAKDLDSVLYAIFTAIIPVNGVPVQPATITTREIDVDKSIRNLTLILKKSNQIEQLFLTNPQGVKRGVLELSEKDISTDNYLFISINGLLTGTWILSGPAQEIERAIVLTEITLVARFASGLYFDGEYLDLKAYFSKKNHIFTDPLILDQMEMTWRLQGAKRHRLYKVPYKKNGIFKLNWHIKLTSAFYKAKLVAKNKYLSRELQYVVELQPNPFEGHVVGPDAYLIQLLKPDLIKVDVTMVRAVLKDTPLILGVTKSTDGWTIDLFTFCSNPSLEKGAYIAINTQTVASREVNFRLPLTSNVCAPNSTTFISEVPKVIMPVTKKTVVEVKKTPVKPIIQKSPTSKFPFLILALFILLFIIIAMTCFLFIMIIKHNKQIESLREKFKEEDRE